MTASTENATPWLTPPRTAALAAARPMRAACGSNFCLRGQERGFVGDDPRRLRGPSGYLHGGIIATLLDESMSKSVRAQGLTAMTRQLEVEYCGRFRLAEPIRLEGRLIRSEGRNIGPREDSQCAGNHAAEGKGLFIEIRTGSRCGEHRAPRMRGTLDTPTGILDANPCFVELTAVPRRKIGITRSCLQIVQGKDLSERFWGKSLSSP